MLVATLAAGGLGGCAGPRAGGRGSGAGGSTAPSGPSSTASTSSGGWFSGWFGRPASPLAGLHERMASAMRGTPVDVEMSGSDLVLVSVPLQHSFDAGRAAVRPALAAVLDRLAGELRTLPEASLAVAGPADQRGSALLAQDRAAATRDWLVSRGVAATRFGRPGRSSESAVEIRISAAALAPAPSTGVR